LFSQFIVRYNKTYTATERAQRFQIFQDNLKIIQRQNQNSKSAKFAVNKFSDLAREEFEKTYLLPKHSAKGVARACSQYASRPPVFSKKVKRDLPTTWDWRKNGGRNNAGVVTPVKNQQQCGSCWTFSATGNIEGLWAMKGNLLTSLSEQLIVDCSKACCNMPPYGPVCNAGCNGGFQWSAFYDIMSWGGLQTEQDYPYTGYDGQCKLNKNKVMAPIKNYTCISSTTGPADEEDMRAYIYKNGPIAIAMDAGLLQSYSSGIIDPWFPNWECDPTALDHALLIVGWGEDENWIGETTPYWIVKNSWSTEWGINGYFWIARNENLCGIAVAVSSANM